MKFTAVLASLALVASVSAAPQPGTNADRLSRGLPPLPPVRRGTPTEVARRHKPSNLPGGGSCNTGPVQCCNSVTKSNSSAVSGLLGLLGIILPVNTMVGMNCTPLSVLSASGRSCSQQPVCCQNNKFNGLINIGCSPINLNL